MAGILPTPEYLCIDPNVPLGVLTMGVESYAHYEG